MFEVNNSPESLIRLLRFLTHHVCGAWSVQMHLPQNNCTFPVTLYAFCGFSSPLGIQGDTEKPSSVHQVLHLDIVDLNT